MLRHNWNWFYFSLDTLKNISKHSHYIGAKYDFRWNLSEKKRKVFISTLIIKRKKQERIFLLLVADAVRPSDIGLYGQSSLTPHLDTFFSSGAVFRNSFAQSNWTLPVFASLATSQYASQHGVVDPDIYLRCLPPHVPTLAELMRANGFFTYASVAHHRCNHSIGHHRGYEYFDYSQTVEVKYNSMGIPGKNNMYRQLQNLCARLDNFRGADFFGMVHFFDTHIPYLYNRNELNTRHLLFQKSVDQCVMESLSHKLKGEEYHYLLYRYQMRLAELDQALLKVFRILKKREKVTVIFMSDHGFSFENPLAWDLSFDKIETPFLIRSNEFDLQRGIQNRMVESSLDVLPTITNLYNIQDSVLRSGTPLFDHVGKIILKEYAISEHVYDDIYQLRLIGKEKLSLLFETSRHRKTGSIDIDGMRLKNCCYQGLSPSIGNHLFLSFLEKAKLPFSLKKKLQQLISQNALQDQPEVASEGAL